LLQHAVIVNLNAVNIEDENVQTADTMVSDVKIKSSEGAVQLPQSCVIMATAEPQPVKFSEVARKNNAKVVVKGSKTLKHRKRPSSFRHLHEARTKHLKHDQKRKCEATSAEWTESLFVSEASDVGRDVAKVASVVDAEELNVVPSSVAASDVLTSAPVVSDGGPLEITSLKRLPQKKSVAFTKLPSEVITDVDASHNETASVPAASGRMSFHKDGVCTDTATDDAAEGSQSKNVNTHLLKSPPAVESLDVCSNIQEILPSTFLHISRNTLPVSSPPGTESRSYSSSASKTMSSFPSNPGNMSAKLVSRPTSNIPIMHTGVIKPRSSIAAKQQHSGGSAVSQTLSQSHSFVQHSMGLDLPSTSKSVVRVVLPPQWTSSAGHTIMVHGKRFHARHSVPSDKLEHSTASYVQQQQPSVLAPMHQQCLTASAVAVHRPVLSPAAGSSHSHSDPRPVTTAPRVVAPAQPVRIRINAADLGNTVDPAAVMSHVRGILSRTNTILPGAQIHIRYMPPPATSSQVLQTQSSSAPQTSMSPHTNSTLSQLDGMADSDDDAQADVVKRNNNESSVSTAVGIENISTGCSRRRSKATDVDKPPSDSRVR